MRQPKSWNVQASTFAKNTFNPIRNIIENLKIIPNPEKAMIALSIGDPTVFGNLKPAREITDAVIESIREGKSNGYAPSPGFMEARQAVATYCSSTPEATVYPKDIILCSGCSCALDLSITALCSPGQNILAPRPGFPLYQTLAEGLGIAVKYYDLLPERSWEVDLEMMEDCIDESTAAIVINNPSNPCGSVFSKDHLLKILAIAERNKVPIIADEIYDNFVFEGQEFHWLASLSQQVPILSCGGLTKRFLVPGWRMGWITIHDRNGIFEKEIRMGLLNLSTRIIGSNTLVQGALPKILSSTPMSFFKDTLSAVQEIAMLSYNMLKKAKGLHPVMPQGAMYMMVGIDMKNFPEFENDLQLVEKMISEESVFCLPGKCFNIANYFRVVLTVPEDQMREACERIEMFCARHYVPTVVDRSQNHLLHLSDKMALDVSVNGTSNGIGPNGIPTTHNGLPNGTYCNGVNGDPESSCSNDSSDDIVNEENGVTNGEDTGQIPIFKVVSMLKRDLIAVEMDGE